MEVDHATARRIRHVALALILVALPATAATLGEQLATHMSALEAYGFSGGAS